MKKIERLSGIIYALHERGKATAKELATTFEVSKRTIYRDINALCQLNVPIIAFEGIDGGYKIDDRYFLPSLQLEQTELLSLLICLRVGGLINVPSMQTSFEMLKLKLLNTVDSTQKKKYRHLIERMTFYVNDINPDEYCEKLFPTIINSFLDYQNLNIMYSSPRKETDTLRVITPYIVTFYDGAWYLHAHCHLRNSTRYFRLDRIRSISLSNSHYTHEFLDSYFKHLQEGQSKIKVVLRVSRQLYEGYKYSIYFSKANITHESDGLLLTIFTTEPDYYVNFVIKHYNEATLIEPELLINEVKEICSAVVEKYCETVTSMCQR